MADSVVPATETLRLETADGHGLEAELAVASEPRAAMVLCHPHPQYGGTMRSMVIGALFDALPRAGVTCLRFNFRGVGASEGRHDEGRGERLDARAALGALGERAPAGAPVVLAGWSFGADVALSVDDPGLAGWLAVAPPLHVHDPTAGVARDPRPKLLVLAAHDEVRSPDEVAALVADWASTEMVVIGGASHFFVGRTDRLVEVVGAFVDRLVSGA
jgi:alpha/beta superfamily hydrolase